MRQDGARLAAVLALVLVVPATAGAAFGGLGQQSVDADVVVLTADVGESGDAAWTIAYRIRLADDNDTQAFADLTADIDRNETAYTDRFRERMGGTVRAAENATGREMALENVTVTAERQTFGQSYGVVTYRFEWTNFAAVDGDGLVVGDALGGLFLDGDTSLTIEWPEGYEADQVTPVPDEESATGATWRGQQSFDADEPRVTLTPAGAGGSGLSPVVVLLVMLAIAAVSAVGYWLTREDDEAADGDDGTPGTEDPADDTPPADLLSNEEQVLKLLEDNGGRLKQQQVAGDLEWTDAKTSQVIGGLREDDAVETFRIGRENVVTLPGTDVTGEADDE